MNGKTQFFIGCTVAAGAALIGVCLLELVRRGSVSLHPAFAVLALIGATRKVRLPGIKSTISLNFLFTLISIALFPFAETVLLAAVTCAAQCLWRPRTRPTLVQVCFNVAVLAISSGAAYRLSHAALPAAPHTAVLITVAGCVYLIADTLLVSGVLSLIQGKSLVRVWQQCYQWAFPYYAAGAVLAGLMVETNRSAGWAVSLALLIPMAFVHAFYSLWVERPGITAAS